MRWVLANMVPLVNIVGIVFDIIGAFLVASEIVSQFHGKQFRDQFTFDPDIAFAPPETDHYKAWNRLKTRRMQLGLGCLVLGFILQLVANVLQFKVAA